MKDRTQQEILKEQIKELRALKIKRRCQLSLCERELNEALAMLKRLNEEERRSASLTKETPPVSPSQRGIERKQ